MSTTERAKSHTPEWEAWRSMLKRCYKPNTHNYERYGGRGISVCDRWRESYQSFYDDLGERPSKKHSLHRVNNDGNYEPGNCCWATPKVQASNRGRPRRGMPRRARPQLASGQRAANFKDLTGSIFGRWTVIEFYGYTPDRSQKSVWMCRCECGTSRPVVATHLASGRSKSCGCLHKEKMAKFCKENAINRNQFHDLSRTKEYAAWNQMNQRCHNPKNPTYRRYGAIGVRVCVRWRHDFMAFLKDMGPCQTTGHSIDRIDAFGNYEPSNCRWATDEQQRMNQRRTRRFMYEGEMRTIQDIANRAGLKYATLRKRLVEQEWPLEKALSEKVGTYTKSH